MQRSSYSRNEYEQELIGKWWNGLQYVENNDILDKK